MTVTGFLSVDLGLHELESVDDLAARRRCRTRARLVGNRRQISCRTSSRLGRARGFFSCHRVTDRSRCSVAARRFLRFRLSCPMSVGRPG